MQNTFYNYLGGRRPITVKIDKELGFITFHFKEEQDRKFYDIPIDEWVSDRSITRQGCEDNWHNHMMQKNWLLSNINRQKDKIFFNVSKQSNRG